MSLKIRVLPEELANKIAAGEVVERPASVVKELVENAIDSGASFIEIEVRGAGKNLISVKDDGSGMMLNDMISSFERHATSKIIKDADLEQIHTLGFRGEALPSIASVSFVTMTSSPQEQGKKGGSIQVDNGKMISCKEGVHPPGTTITVSKLFSKVPVRKKFLKSDTTEQQHITDTVARMILASQGPGFLYRINGRVFAKIPPGTGLKEKIKLLFGNSIADKLLDVSCSSGNLSLSGFLMHPNFSLSHNKYQFCFLNGRYIRDKVVIHAIQASLKPFLPQRRYAGFFLSLRIPYDQVDVNVHPAKYEVRFLNPSSVHFLFEQAVSNALSARSIEPETEREERASFPSFSETNFTSSLSSSQKPYDSNPHNKGAKDTGKPNSSFFSPPNKKPASFSGYHKGAEWQPASGTFSPSFPQQGGENRDNRTDPSASSLPKEGVIPLGFSPVSPDINFSSLRYIGQLSNAFLLFEDGEESVIVDQHTAHERINKEGLTKKYNEGAIESSKLLFPHKLELPLAVGEQIIPQLPNLKRLGFEVTHEKPNGEREQFQITALPALLAEESPEQLFDDICNALVADNKPNFASLIDSLLDLIACHSAVRANHPLTEREAKQLCIELDQLNHRISCPHGRPIALRLSKHSLYKAFGRL